MNLGVRISREELEPEPRQRNLDAWKFRLPFNVVLVIILFVASVISILLLVRHLFVIPAV